MLQWARMALEGKKRRHEAGYEARPAVSGGRQGGEMRCGEQGTSRCNGARLREQTLVEEEPLAYDGPCVARHPAVQKGVPPMQRRSDHGTAEEGEY